MGLILSWCHTWVKFVIGFRPTLRGFLQVFQFFSPIHKNQNSKFQSYQDRGSAWKPAKADVTSSIIIITLASIVAEFPHESHKRQIIQHKK